MPRYGLAAIFEPHPIGYEFTSEKLPLHLTLIDSFEIDLSPHELAHKLGKLLTAQSSFNVTALTDELYGPDKDIPVTTVTLTPELKKLHDNLVTFVRSEKGTLRYPEYNGDHYSPHVSVYGSRRISIGDSVTVQDLSIAAKVSDAEDASRQVLANIVLGD